MHKGKPALSAGSPCFAASGQLLNISGNQPLPASASTVLSTAAAFFSLARPEAVFSALGIPLSVSACPIYAFGVRPKNVAHGCQCFVMSSDSAAASA